MTIQQRLFTSPQDVYGSDDYFTPPWIFERLDLRFSLDVCAPPGGVPWIPAERFFTQEDDGLAQEWEGLVWCNPPYSEATPWVHRMVEHDHGFLLLPFGVNSHWLSTLWDGGAAVTLLPSDMFFVRPDQTEQRIMFRPSLWAFGDVARSVLDRIGIVR